MSTSVGANVLRYSALGLGLFYGLFHQASLSTSAKTAAVKREYEHKKSLIEQAKAEYTKKNQPPPKETGIIRDPDDSRFDLEALLNDISAQETK